MEIDLGSERLCKFSSGPWKKSDVGKSTEFQINDRRFGRS